MVRGEVEKKMVEGGEVEIFLGEVEVGEENGRMEKVWRIWWKEKEGKKRKRNWNKGRYFSWKRK